MNTVKEIQEALDALVVEMAEAGLANPSVDYTMKDVGRKYVYMTVSGGPFEGGRNGEFFHGDTPADCFAKARAFIAALPSPEDRVTHEYLSKVAAAVDFATEHSLPDEYVAPLRGVSVAMTSNLLTHEVAS